MLTTADQIMLQSTAAEVRILVENLYKFEGFEAEKFIREFREELECQKFKRILNLRDPGLPVQWQNEREVARRRNMRSDTLLVFTR